MDADELHHGITLLNAEQFFEAHEVLEDVWRAAPASEKTYLQGLVQIAVALHHYTHGNLVGARSVLARAHRNLREAPAAFRGLDIAELRHLLAACEQDLQRGDIILNLPKVRFSG